MINFDAPQVTMKNLLLLVQATKEEFAMSNQNAYYAGYIEIDEDFAETEQKIWEWLMDDPSTLILKNCWILAPMLEMERKQIPGTQQVELMVHNPTFVFPANEMAPSKGVTLCLQLNNRLVLIPDAQMTLEVEGKIEHEKRRLSAAKSGLVTASIIPPSNIRR